MRFVTNAVVVTNDNVNTFDMLQRDGIPVIELYRRNNPKYFHPRVSKRCITFACPFGTSVHGRLPGTFGGLREILGKVRYSLPKPPTVKPRRSPQRTWQMVVFRAVGVFTLAEILSLSDGTERNVPRFRGDLRYAAGRSPTGGLRASFYLSPNGWDVYTCDEVGAFYLHAVTADLNFLVNIARASPETRRCVLFKFSRLGDIFTRDGVRWLTFPRIKSN